ncbi:MAG: iron chelate uptake ABC transporter family permease subunit [Oscillospiraceae bacterium]
MMPIRLPRVLCVALTGAALSLAGAAMQGLLKNPLADGSTLGVSSGASLGAVCAIAFGVTLPGFPFAGTMVMAILFAFGSLLVILGLSYKLDRSLLDQHDHPHRRDLLDVRLEHHEHCHHLCRR